MKDDIKDKIIELQDELITATKIFIAFEGHDFKEITGSERLESDLASLKSQLSEAGEAWTDNDIDSAYLFGIICASGYTDVQVSIDNPFPSFDIINKEIHRLKELGYMSPHNAIRELRKPR